MAHCPSKTPSSLMPFAATSQQPDAPRFRFLKLWLSTFLPVLPLCPASFAAPWSLIPTFYPLSPLSPYLFGKLYFHHSRTYLQEPALMPARRHQVMSDRKSSFFAKTAFIAASALVLSPLGALAQSAPAPASSSQSRVSASKDRWLHVRVISSHAKGETVRVNVTL